MKFVATASTPADQFRCEVFGAVSEILAGLPRDTAEALEREFPTLADYGAAAQACWKGDGAATPIQWRRALTRIAQDHPAWPLQRLPLLGLGPLHARALVVLAMVEEDPALSLLFEAEPGPLSHGGLVARLRAFAGIDAPEAVRDALADLCAASLIEVDGRGAARADRRYRISDPIAELLLGATPRLAGFRYRPADALPVAGQWIAPGDRAPAPGDAAAALAAPGTVMLVRSAAHNGRKTFAAMAAREAGLGLLECPPPVLADDTAWRSAGAIATLSGSAMLVELELVPSETVRLPASACDGSTPLIVVCGLQGAVELTGAVALRTFRLPMPTAAARAAQWRDAGLDGHAEALGKDWILTSGNIRRAAAVAGGSIAAGADETAARKAVRAALRDLRDARIETLARPVDADSAPAEAILDSEAQEELDMLVARCRHREALCERGGLAGVRALISGPSGIGKTLAARHVAWRLERDLFRIDLAATVNKYIGETEKALERALAAAEELDVVLLLDEGDALMAKRTDVANANDRYANLETNFLLQRIENFGGILLVTSNDPARIDPAFTRRMDSSIVLRPPDQVRREAILVAHLGSEASVSLELLRDIACRCDLTGGQVRNVAIHARLLGLEGRGRITDRELRSAIEREYRKLGTPCPLRGNARLAAVG
jgi:hypothetical protein